MSLHQFASEQTSTGGASITTGSNIGIGSGLVFKDVTGTSINMRSMLSDQNKGTRVITNGDNIELYGYTTVSDELYMNPGSTTVYGAESNIDFTALTYNTCPILRSNTTNDLTVTANPPIMRNLKITIGVNVVSGGGFISIKKNGIQQRFLNIATNGYFELPYIFQSVSNGDVISMTAAGLTIASGVGINRSDYKQNNVTIETGLSR